MILRNTSWLWRTASVSLIFTLYSATTAFAGGFAILEQSPEGLGQAYAGSGLGFGDGSSVYYNPAAMTDLEGTTITAGASVIMSQAEFSNTSSSLPALGLPLTGSDGPDGGETGTVPNVYVATPISDIAWFGLGLNAPFGLATEYDREWVGRYHAVESELKTVNINPAIGWTPWEDFSLGVGARVIYSDATLSNVIDFGTIGLASLGPGAASALGLAPQQNDGFAQVEGDDWSYGYTLGAMYKPCDHWRLGMAFQSKVHANLDGDATFEVPTNAAALQSTGAFTDTTASADVTYPENLLFSTTYDISERWRVAADAQWTHWSRFDELRVRFGNGQADSVTEENWSDSWRFALGTSYQIMDSLMLRFGGAYDEEPIRGRNFRTPRIPGNDRWWLSTGLVWTVMDSLNLNLNYTHIFVPDTGSDVVNETGHNLVGDWDLSVDIISAGFTYTFS